MDLVDEPGSEGLLRLEEAAQLEHALGTAEADRVHEHAREPRRCHQPWAVSRTVAVRGCGSGWGLGVILGLGLGLGQRSRTPRWLGKD